MERFQRVRRAAVALLILLLVGLLTRPIEAPAWEAVRSRQPELRLADLEGALGQGLVIGVVGGLRTIVADFLWIQLNSVWEKREQAKLNAMIEVVTTLDPRVEFFWINGARMVGYDVPNWRIQNAGGYRKVPEVRQREIDREQAERAFALIREAMEFHPDNPRFPLEIAQIYLNRLKDDAKAAEWFLRAWEMGGPYFTARIHAELLRRQGRQAEAYAFLKDLYPDLPDDNPYAQKEVILERIGELESELEVPPDLRFNPRVPDTRR
ncbi:MAG: tetratricopeptide repeat protein [Verrucomicrobiota bacterium]